MFDNLREQANSTPFYEEEAQFQPAAASSKPSFRSPSGRLLGTTAMQRFILAVMLMLMVCILGTMAMLLTGKFFI